MGVTLQEVVPLRRTNCTPENLTRQTPPLRAAKVTAVRPAGLGLAHRVVQDPGLHLQEGIKTANIRTIMAKDRHFDDNGKNGAEDELVLPALPAVGEDVAANVIQRTADFLKSRNKNRGGILHSTSGNIRPVSASNNMNDDDIVFSKRRTKRLHSLDKENISAHKINRAKSAAGRRRQDRNQNITFDAKNGAKKDKTIEER